VCEWINRKRTLCATAICPSRFYEEASRRADRVWQSPAEQLTLICFEGPRRRLLAEAVQITPR